jgi:hypothetical protein
MNARNGGDVVAERFELDGASFELVCVRRTGVAVFRGNGSYLRLGGSLADELAVQRVMLAQGYPVPQILEVGERDGTPYLVEESVGEQTLGDTWERRAGRAQPTAEEFAGFRDLMRRQARAQVKVRRPWKSADLADFLGVRRACENLPLLVAAIEAAFEEAAARLGRLPSTLQHGDLHPFNTCARGVIDLEGAGWAPAGYDVTTAVLDPTLAEGVWERRRLTLAWFTPEQVTTYLGAIDEEFRRASLPLPSRLVDAYLVCRAIAMCSRIHPDHEVWERRQLVLERALRTFLDVGRFPIALEGAS